MLGRAAERFIRTEWGSLQQLAEELYAIFSPLQPLEVSKITINQPDGDTSPPLVINRTPDSTGSSISINRGRSDITFGDISIHGSNFGDTGFDLGNEYGLPDTGITIEIANFNEVGDPASDITGLDLSTVAFPGQEAGSVPDPLYNPLMLHGVVVSKTSGQTYSVDVWAKAPTGPKIGRIPVRFPMVDENEEIPAGAIAPVMIFPGESGDNRVILDAVGYIPVWFQTAV